MDSACLLCVYDFPKMMRVFMSCMGSGALHRGLVPCSVLVVAGDRLSFFALFSLPSTTSYLILPACALTVGLLVY